MKISLIVVNHNGKKFLDRMLKTAFQQKLKPYEVILVDTGSIDNSVEFVKKNFSKTKIFITENRGYGNAVNFAASKARGDYIAMFNEDMYLPKDFLSTLVNYRNSLSKIENKIGAIGCRIIPFGSDPDETPLNYGGTIDYFGFPTNPLSNKKNPFMINGSPFFIDKKLFLKVRGFNPSIFLYGEDEDLCWRLQLLGYKIYICNDAYLYHFGYGVVNENREKKVAFVLSSPVVPLLSNYSLSLLLLIIPLFILLLIAINIGVFILTKFNIEYNVAIAREYLRILRKLPTILKLRTWVQKKRFVNDWVIIRQFSLVPSIIRNASYKRLINLKLRA